MWSRSLFRGDLFTRCRFPDLGPGTSNHRKISAQQLLHTAQTLRLKNLVKHKNEFIPYPISVDKSKEKGEVDSGDTDYTMHRLENIVKKEVEFNTSVGRSKKEVEDDSGVTDYTSVLITLFWTVSVLVCFSHKVVVTMGSSKKGSITMRSITMVSVSCSTVLCDVLLYVSVSVSLCLLCTF